MTRRLDHSGRPIFSSAEALHVAHGVIAGDAADARSIGMTLHLRFLLAAFIRYPWATRVEAAARRRVDRIGWLTSGRLAARQPCSRRIGFQRRATQGHRIGMVGRY